MCYNETMKEILDRRILAGHFSIDQLMVLDAVDRAGSVLNAAKLLKRAHSALLRSLDQAEEIAGSPLLDRSGYRLSLNDYGKKLLQTGRQILRLESELLDLVEHSNGSETSSLSLVYDGALSPTHLIRAAALTQKSYREARMSLFSTFLKDVESEFDRRQADIMISLVEPQQSYEYRRKLPVIKNVLVAQAGHAVTHRRQSVHDLLQYPILIVSSGAEALYKEKFAIEVRHQIQLPDFHAKRLALLNGLGFGWMPLELIEKDIEAEKLRQVRWEGESTFEVNPVLYLRRPIKAASKLVAAFVQNYLTMTV
jgi:DNA-binding transcriptional LysR family regulator